MGMETITEDLEAVNHLPAAKLFRGINKSDLIRPVGQVDLLIGIHIAEIHPLVADAKRHKRGNLRLLSAYSRLLACATTNGVKLPSS